jgi:hypothetical protein
LDNIGNVSFVKVQMNSALLALNKKGIVHPKKGA